MLRAAVTAGNGSTDKYFVIEATEPSWWILRDGVPASGSKMTFPADAIADFKARNLWPHAVGTYLMAPEGKTVSQGTVDTIFRDGFWDEFYAKYPDRKAGVVHVTLPGYSRSGRQAVVFVRAQSAGLAGYGALFLLESDGSDWKVVDEAVVWVS